MKLRLAGVSVASLILPFLIGCSQRSHHSSVMPAFYYWKSGHAISRTERGYIDSLEVKKLYVRYFDIDWDYSSASPLPVSQITSPPDLRTGTEIIPTIFVTNRCLQMVKVPDIDGLATRIVEKIQAINNKALNSIAVREIQFDCDWSESTRLKYFSLIRAVRSNFPANSIKLSATIRLHQVKYASITGIPPVDRGVLMFYNMGELSNPETINSILDLKTARKYLSQLARYPLHLDVALPIYSWGVLLRRGNVIDLLNNISEDEFNDTARFRISDSTILVLKSTFFNYLYLYQGDRIRIERTSLELLQESVDVMKERLNSDTLSVIFFHLDAESLKKYPHEELQNLCDRFL